MLDLAGAETAAETPEAAVPEAAVPEAAVPEAAVPAAQQTAVPEPSEVQTEERAVPQEAKTDMQAKTLYMFSDMEGCQISNSDKEENSIAMCHPKFYSKLDEMMENNKNMHVAFLGDYFDAIILAKDSK